jgi:hypothetical protein
MEEGYALLANTVGTLWCVRAHCRETRPMPDMKLRQAVFAHVTADAGEHH